MPGRVRTGLDDGRRSAHIVARGDVRRLGVTVHVLWAGHAVDVGTQRGGIDEDVDDLPAASAVRRELGPRLTLMRSPSVRAMAGGLAVGLAVGLG
jgi:hypothetical protein